MLVVHWISQSAVLVFARIAGCNHPLLAEEASLSEGVNEARNRELRSGRYVARIGIQNLGFNPEPILSGHEGEPLWQKGICGSLSHTAEFVTALIALSEHYRAVGVDVNDARELGTFLDNRVMDANERTLLAESSKKYRLDAGNLAFSAKEAIFKCQYVVTGSADFAFHDMRLFSSGMLDTFAIRSSRLEIAVGRQIVEKIGVSFVCLQGQVIATAQWLK